MAEAAALTERGQEKLLRRIDRCIESNAFVLGYDFGDWSQRIASEHQALSEATAASEVAEVINRALSTYDVSHFRIETPEAMEARKEGESFGTGFKTLRAEAGRIVNLVLPESPASEIGMERGDLILSIDGERVDGADLTDAMDEKHFSRAGRLKGHPAHERRIEWARGDQRFDAGLGVGSYPAALPTTLRWLEGDIAWLTISSFRAGAYDRSIVDAAFEEVRARPAAALVIDQRGNGGGQLGNVLHLAARLLPRDALVGRTVTRKQGRRKKELRNLGAGDLPAGLGEPLAIEEDAGSLRYDGPLVILTDETNGSGGDLFPGAMREARGATLIGGKTAGALLGGSWCKLPDGYRLLYPSIEIVLPDGARLEGVGVTPDRLLAPEETIDDTRMEELALEMLRG